MPLMASRGRRFKSCPRYYVMSRDGGSPRTCMSGSGGGHFRGLRGGPRNPDSPRRRGRFGRRDCRRVVDPSGAVSLPSDVPGRQAKGVCAPLTSESCPPARWQARARRARGRSGPTGSAWPAAGAAGRATKRSRRGGSVMPMRAMSHSDRTSRGGVRRASGWVCVAAGDGREVLGLATGEVAHVGGGRPDLPGAGLLLRVVVPGAGLLEAVEAEAGPMTFERPHERPDRQVDVAHPSAEDVGQHLRHLVARRSGPGPVGR